MLLLMIVIVVIVIVIACKLAGVGGKAASIPIPTLQVALIPHLILLCSKATAHSHVRNSQQIARTRTP